MLVYIVISLKRRQNQTHVSPETSLSADKFLSSASWKMFLFFIFLFPFCDVSTRFRVMASFYGDSRLHSLNTQHSVGLFWTSDQPDTETSTWQHTALTTDKLPRPRGDSNTQPQQASSHRSTL